MIDLKLIRDNPSFLDEALKKRSQDELSATVLMLDKENREIIKELQTIQEARNEKSKKIGELSASGKNDEADKYKNEVSNLKDKLQELKSVLSKAEEINISMTDVVMYAQFVDVARELKIDLNM